MTQAQEPESAPEGGMDGRHDRARKRLRIAVIAAAGLPLVGLASAAVWTLSGGKTAGAVPVNTAANGVEIPANLPEPEATAATDTVEIAPEDAFAINAARPFDAKPDKAAAFRFGAGAADLTRAEDCLAAAVLYEAGDDRTGQRAVAQVVLNRVRHPAYPKSVCGVVFEGSDRKTGCQFTFTCDGAMRRTPSTAAWDRARDVAAKALAGDVDADVGTATHYHADYVLPRWAPQLQKVAQVGPHIFYRWPGSFGSRAIFRDQGSRVEPQIRQLAAFGNHGDSGEDNKVELAALPEMTPDATVPGMGGNPLAPAKPADDARIVMQFDIKGPSGRWAMQALNNCGDRPNCEVVGYAGLPGPRPLFFYLREKGASQGRALWDCRRVSRPSADQCLPEDAAALSHLLRPRNG